MDQTDSKSGEYGQSHPESPFADIGQPPRSDHQGRDDCSRLIGVPQPPIHPPDIFEEILLNHYGHQARKLPTAWQARMGYFFSKDFVYRNVFLLMKSNNTTGSESSDISLRHQLNHWRLTPATDPAKSEALQAALTALQQAQLKNNQEKLDGD